MTVLQFERLIESVLQYLSEDCKKRPDSYKKSGEDFEPLVKEAVDHALRWWHITDTVDYTPGGHGFPDIVIAGPEGNKFGIEVKSSTGSGGSWRINGNSVLGSTRVPGIKRNMIIFGKLRGKDSIFRAKDYEKCIANVVVTHSPRYLIDLDLEDGDGFFDKSNLSYEIVSTSDQPIKLITDYFLSIGQTAWWLAESTPAAIQMFGKVPKAQQCSLMGYAFSHYTEIFSNSGTKFYRYMTWLTSEHSIIDPSLRDRFTAGGKADVRLEKKTYLKLPRIFTNLHEFRKYVILELESADLAILHEDWGLRPKTNPAERVNQWAALVASCYPDDNIDFAEKKQMLLDIILDPEDW